MDHVTRVGQSDSVSAAMGFDDGSTSAGVATSSPAANADRTAKLAHAAVYPCAGIGGHWAPEGHRFVADRIYGLLSADDLIEPSPRQ